MSNKEQLQANNEILSQLISDIQKNPTGKEFKTNVAEAITAKGVETSPEDGFDTLIENIRKIQTLEDAPGLEAQEWTPGVEDQVIAAGNYLVGDQTIKGDADLVSANIAVGKNVFGVDGSYTSDGTVTSAKMLKDEVGYANGVRVVGSIESQAAQTITPGTAVKTIAAGKYLEGVQTIAGDSNLVAANIAKGKSIFGVTGTYEPASISNILGKSIKCIGYKEFSGSEANIPYGSSKYYVAALAANTSFTIECDQDIVAVCFWMYPGYTNGFAYWIFPTSGVAGVRYPYNVLGNSSATIPTTIPDTDTNSHFSFEKVNISTGKYTIGISGVSPTLTTSSGFLTINSRSLVWNNSVLLYLGTSSSIQTGARIGLYAYGYS